MNNLKKAYILIENLIQEAGYFGYSMSNNAVAAYGDGKMPLSKWTKRDIIQAVEYMDGVDEDRINWLKKQTTRFLKELLLISNEWHHTSSSYNRTDFYEVSEEKLLADEEQWNEYVAIAQEALNDTKSVDSKRKHGKFFWLTWEGTRKHPRARLHELLDAYVEERGSFYFVYDRGGNLVVKKKIGSNGTEFVEGR